MADVNWNPWANPVFGTADTNAMMPETYANPAFQLPQGFFSWRRPDDTSQVRYTTASPYANITDQDIARGMNVAMSAGPGTIRGTAPKLVVANKYDNGSIIIGKPGQIHGDLPEEGIKEAGFVTPDGQYLDRSQALEWVEKNENKNIRNFVRPDEDLAPNQLESIDYSRSFSPPYFAGQKQ